MGHDLINENNSIIHQKPYENLQRTQKKASIREMFDIIQALIFNKHNSQEFFNDVLQFVSKQTKGNIQNSNCNTPNFLAGVIT